MDRWGYGATMDAGGEGGREGESAVEPRMRPQPWSSGWFRLGSTTLTSAELAFSFSPSPDRVHEMGDLASPRNPRSHRHGDAACLWIRRGADADPPTVHVAWLSAFIAANEEVVRRLPPEVDRVAGVTFQASEACALIDLALEPELLELMGRLGVRFSVQTGPL